ncbi:MAG: hypothetical protein A9Z00_08675 [Thermobacillus sp. ZCTH02-B1]|uniref:hypothetical protein n=1 Tax=Thermobacillus sp. ZCTH02-B1 TaxID=1858795 RepID=UPI000B570747|nr:hypothetical protein [Thermobacillus sp. ZCTH02-B1]OUM95406.1 MAG: hypothetical protein A9Z00_08675 [Thermobacillus sp. ZCTH02-B1]
MAREGFKPEDRQEETDLAVVESQRNDLTAEEFPEGPYGSPLATESLGKSEPHRIDQRSPRPFNYEDLAFHEGMERGYPGDQGKPDELDPEG